MPIVNNITKRTMDLYILNVNSEIPTLGKFKGFSEKSF